MRIDPHLIIRAGALYVPIVLLAIAILWRRPDRRALTGAFLSLVWTMPALLALHVAATRWAWWSFSADGGLLVGMPIDFWIGWGLLWGPVPAIAFPRLRLPYVVLLGLVVDLFAMPALAPVLHLHAHWLVGETVALVVVLVPSQWLARWTTEHRRLYARASLQVIAFGTVVIWLIPAIAIEGSATSWRNPFDWHPWLFSIVMQLLAVPGLIGLSAVQEFATRGGGTPIPFDPPRRLVTTGVYAYVANPMQLSASLVLAGIGAIVGNVWVASSSVIAVAYSAGLAHWDEDADLATRFGAAWPAYRRNVRHWVPRLRPWYRDDAPVATLYVSESCDMCREVAYWYRARGARGLAIVPAEDHPRGGLTRITYESADGSYRATGTDAIARAFEHLHAGWAMAGFAMRLPLVAPLVQLIVDASGGQPRLANPRAAGGAGSAG